MVQYLKTAFKVTYISNILFLALAIAVALPLLNRELLYPLYEEMSIQRTEKEAVHLASTLVSQIIGTGPFSPETAIPNNEKKMLTRMIHNFEVYKLRLFDLNGGIVYSSEPDEIGQVNTEPYFSETVDRNRPHTAIVRKQTQSLEGETIPIDVAETYIPIVNTKNRVTGVLEIYYDLTATLNDLKALNSRTNAWMAGTSVLLIMLILVTAAQAGRIIQEKEQMEKKAREKEILSAVIETAGGVCHEVNQPLQVISGYCELLSDSPDLDESTRTAVKSIRNQVKRIRELNLKLMRITRFETKPYVNAKIIDLEKSSGTTQPVKENEDS